MGNTSMNRIRRFHQALGVCWCHAQHSIDQTLELNDVYACEPASTAGITYAALPQPNRFFSACAMVLLDGVFFGFVYPYATSDVDRLTGMIGLTFNSEVDTALCVDLAPDQLALLLDALTRSIPPF